MSGGLTGADLKAVAEDAKLLYAHERSKGLANRAPEECFLDAIETIRVNRRNYAKRKPLPWTEMKIGFQVDHDEPRKTTRTSASASGMGRAQTGHFRSAEPMPGK